jgi:hypothetical protein
VATIANLVDTLGDEIDFRIVTRDRDCGDTKPYEGVLFRQMQRQRRHARRAAREPWRQGALMTP